MDLRLLKRHSQAKQRVPDYLRALRKIGGKSRVVQEGAEWDYLSRIVHLYHPWYPETYRWGYGRSVGVVLPSIGSNLFRLDCAPIQSDA